MNFDLKSYVLWALCEEEDSQDENKIYIGEHPYFEAFYERILGRTVDWDEEDEEIPEIRAYFENYEISQPQLESITGLDLIGAYSVNEMLIAPFEDDTKVQSLDGIETLVNLEWIDLDLFRGNSLEPLAKLNSLKSIGNLPFKSDYAPLLDIPTLKRVQVSGVVNERDFGNNSEILEQLRQKGVEVVDEKLEVTKGGFRF